MNFSPFASRMFVDLWIRWPSSLSCTFWNAPCASQTLYFLDFLSSQFDCTLGLPSFPVFSSMQALRQKRRPFHIWANCCGQMQGVIKITTIVDIYWFGVSWRAPSFLFQSDAPHYTNISAESLLFPQNIRNIQYDKKQSKISKPSHMSLMVEMAYL